MPFIFLIPSAISLVVYLVFNGFNIAPAPGSSSIRSDTLTISILVFGELTARLASASDFQKNPLPPSFCI